jgi:hypothetical protein
MSTASDIELGYASYCEILQTIGEHEAAMLVKWLFDRRMKSWGSNTAPHAYGLKLFHCTQGLTIGGARFAMTHARLRLEECVADFQAMSLEKLGEGPVGNDLRQGLPCEELRKAWPEWQDQDGDLIHFSPDGLSYRCWMAGWSALLTEDVLQQKRLAATRFRPHGKTWAEVEALAKPSYDHLVGAIFEITDNRITENGQAMQVRVDAIEGEMASTTSTVLAVKRLIRISFLTDPDAYKRVSVNG